MIQASDVKALREKTGAGMMDCKKALTETNGNFEEAIKVLREKGLASAAKKAERIAAEGVVNSAIAADGRAGVIVEVNCETDFVAKTPAYLTFVKQVAEKIMDSSPTDVDALLAMSMGDATVSDAVKEKIAEIGEKISIRRFERFGIESGKEGLIESYIHLGGKIGVLVEAGCETSAVAKSAEFKTFVRDIAMQIAAANPGYIDQTQVPSDVIESEKNILRAQAIAEGKPENIAVKMVEGRIQKYFKEVCLLEQPFVKDQDKTVKKLISEKCAEFKENLSIRRFVRFEMGEGLEKRKDDFAEEVLKQTNQ